MDDFVSTLTAAQIENVLTSIHGAVGIVACDGDGEIRAANAGEIASALSNGTLTTTQKTAIKTAIGLNIKTTSVSLPATGWSTDKSQQKSVSGMTSDSIVIVSPAAESFLTYGASQIRATYQGSNYLSFTCETVPADSITVNILFI